MTYSTKRLALLRSSVARIAAALACATALGVLGVPSAVADEGGWGDRGGRRYGYGHENDRRQEQPRRHRHHYYPVYSPPPVYYRHEESPGISVFIPWDVR